MSSFDNLYLNYKKLVIIGCLLVNNASWALSAATHVNIDKIPLLLILQCFFHFIISHALMVIYLKH